MQMDGWCDVSCWCISGGLHPPGAGKVIGRMSSEETSGVPKGGNRGSRPPPTFLKYDPRDWFKNDVKLIGGGV